MRTVTIIKRTSQYGSLLHVGQILSCDDAEARRLIKLRVAVDDDCDDSPIGKIFGDRLSIVAITKSFLPTTRGGSEVALYGLMRFFQKRGHQVAIHVDDKSYKENEIDGIPIVYQMPDDADICIANRVDGWDGRQFLGKSSARFYQYFHCDVQHHGHRTITCAKWLQQKYGSTLVQYPSTNIDAVIADDCVRDCCDGKKILFINLNVRKGSKDFWELAKMMPDKEFVALKSWGYQYIPYSLPNVTICENVADMRPYYNDASFLLFLSPNGEGFPTVMVEAMANSVPVIAYRIPATQEVLGNTGNFFQHHDYDAMASFIQRGYDDDGFYRSLSETAKQRAGEIRSETLQQLDALEHHFFT